MNADEKKCPDCAEFIKVDARKCRFCGTTFSDNDVRRERVTRAIENASDEEEAIDEALMRARPFYAKELRGERALYYLGRRETVRTEDDVRQLAEEAGTDFHKMKARLSTLGYVVVASQEDAEDLQQKQQEEHEARMRRIRSIGKPVADNQYGVLQPAANLFGGCVNMWLWLILVFVLLMVVAALFG